MIIMNVIQRNLFRLLRAGAFDSLSDTIEPMSEWKWTVLYNLSLMNGVTALVYDGIKKYHDDFHLTLTDAQIEIWNKATTDIENHNRDIDKQTEELFAILNHEQTRPILLRGQSLTEFYDIPLHRITGNIDIYFPYEPQFKKANQWAKSVSTNSTSNNYYFCYNWNGINIKHHAQAQKLTNIFLNNRLQNIIDKEIRCCDSTYIHVGETKIETVPPTLNILLAIVRVSSYILNEGISLKQLVDLGILLQRASNNIDIDKLLKWVDNLHMRRMMQFECGTLMNFFNFTENDFQFITPITDKAIDKIKDDIFSFSSVHNANWYFTQGKNIFVRASNTSAMTWQIKHLARFLFLYPSESITNFASSFAHSLSHIEE